MTDTLERPAEVVAPSGRSVRTVLLAVIAVALLVIAGAAGWLLRGGSSPVVTPTAASVDAGFARDMATHHTQAVVMAGYERDHTTNPSLKLLATDIETSQQFQIGEMQGWLDAWGLSRNSAHEMSWMPASAMGMSMSGSTQRTKLGPNSLMPGMATPDQMTRLQHLTGRPMDVLFLQLMLRHHEGGMPMARYAVEHAQTAEVRDMAQSIINSQSTEITEMTQLLHRLGGTPLPAPTA